MYNIYERRMKYVRSNDSWDVTGIRVNFTTGCAEHFFMALQ